MISGFLENIPGINAPAVRQQIANLKTSGDYARLIAGVEADIARDHPEALEAIAAAREAARKAAEQPKTFDFEGVARHLKNPYQVDVFRQEVTKEAILQLLPVDQQAPLAARLVRHAEEQGWHVSGEFIRREIRNILNDEQGDFRAFIHREQDRLAEQDETYALQRAVDALRRHVGGLDRAGRRIAKLLEAWPADQTAPAIDYGLCADIYLAAQVLDRLTKDRRFAFEPDTFTETAESQSRRQISRNGARLALPVSAAKSEN